jgi:transposase InsO family protein
MIALGLLFLRLLCDRFKPRRQLETEILVLRHQLNILQQRAPSRPHLRWADRALFIWLYRRCPRILNAITVVRPETVLRWHRMGFAAYWGWKSGSPGGRPRIAKEVRDLIRRMSLENPLWGATKIHGELLKLGIQVAQSTVSTYMVPRRDRPLQTWKTFVRNHMEGIAAIDLFVVPTIAFEQLLFNAEHLRRILAKYASYYNEVRTHVALGKDTPCRRPIERFGDIVAYPILGGLHHRYTRI